jgi:hypothetical protein
MTGFQAYVDETGDRGWTDRASRAFALTAVVVADADVARCAAALDELCDRFAKPRGTTLHWTENVKDHVQRKLVARTLAALPITVINIIVMKEALRARPTQLSDPTSMYNYAVRRLLERVSWLVADAGGTADTTFAHVRRFPYEHLRDYLALLRTQRTQVRWAALPGALRFGTPADTPGLQLADLAAGCLSAALKPDPFGDHEPAYLLTLAPRIYVRGGGRVSSYGMNVIGPAGAMDAYPWWRAYPATRTVSRFDVPVAYG